MQTNCSADVHSWNREGYVGGGGRRQILSCYVHGSRAYGMYYHYRVLAIVLGFLGEGDLEVKKSAMQFFKFTAWSILVAHCVESLYTFSLCWKHSTGFLVGVSILINSFCQWVKWSLYVPQALYVLSTLVCGWPIWRDLGIRIRAARIDSMMKIQ